MANDEILATSSPTGLSIIGRRFDGSDYVHDIYTTKMTMNPETGERYFSFAPLNALARSQAIAYSEFVKIANRGVNCGIYTPDYDVIAAYLDFVDSEERKNIMADFYLKECGPLQEFLDKEESEKCASIKTAEPKTTCEGNIITAPFGRN